MKFTIKKNILDQTIEFISKYVDSINVFMPFRCVKIDVSFDKITFIASNGLMSTKKILKVDEINIKVEIPGIVLINNQYFKNIIKKLNNEISVESNGKIIKIWENEISYTLNCVDVEFPNIDFKKPENSFEINTNKLEKAIRNVSFSASSETSGKSLILKCINFSSKNDILRLVATDTFRLSTETIKINKPINVNFSIESKNIKNMITKEAPKNVIMFIDESKVGIVYENTIIQSSIVDVPFVSFEGIIPTEFSRKISIKKSELLDLLNKVVFIQQEKYNRVEFKINKDLLTLSTNLSDIGQSTGSTTEFELIGDPIDIDFNYVFIKDALTAFENDEINLCINKNGNIMLIVSKSNENNKQVITPLRRY